MKPVVPVIPMVSHPIFSTKRIQGELATSKNAKNYHKNAHIRQGWMWACFHLPQKLNIQIIRIKVSKDSLWLIPTNTHDSVVTGTV
jgi:hypothetical protein